MSSLPHNLYTAAQVQRLDRIAIDKYQLPGAKLMERAGTVAFSVLRKRWPGARTLAVLCGVGNNGGDGFVLARLAAEAGLTVQIYQVGDAGRIKGDAAAARQRLQGTAVGYDLYQGQALRDFDLIVDGLLGTGLQGEVSDVWRNAIEAVNQSARPVLALDIPSGLHGDSGRVLGCAVRAMVTVTFIGVKQGLLTGAGPLYAGKVVFSDLQVPPEIYGEVPPSSHRLHRKLLEENLPPRPRDAHKGSFGHVLIIGGNLGMSGAAQLAALAAGRVGAGLVSVATRRQHAMQLNLQQPEIMVHAVQDPVALEPLLARASVVAIGPGLGQDDWARSVWQTALATRLPLVVDADALNLLSMAPADDDAADTVVRKRDNWILTPHPGEAARLLACNSGHVQADRFSAVRELQNAYGGVIVLKGAGTLVVGENFAISLCAEGNPGMASGGMGDILSGVIAGLTAQGLSLTSAAQLGVYLHALAGDRAAQEGERGMLASDLLPYLRHFANPGRR